MSQDQLLKRSPQASLKDLKRAAEAGKLSLKQIRALGDDDRATVRAFAASHLRRRRDARREQARLTSMLTFERAAWRAGKAHVAGVDEVGAGPLAGPVVAAAVILPPGCRIVGIDDSKRLTAAARERLVVTIKQLATAWAVGACSAAEIDRWNILQAAKQAMYRAVTALETAPDHILVDARRIPDVPQEQDVLIRGDQRSHAIAAASILAKVERDAQMAAYAEEFPGYGFDQHHGYGTAEHLSALAQLGPCPLHRRSFRPVAEHAQAALAF